MRVIAGSARGRRLQSVPGTGTRPITNRAKSALFSILGNLVVGSKFLDLYAGTGQVGIEALSRGGNRAVFVEQSSAALRTIWSNLRHTQLDERAVVERADVLKYLVHPPQAFDFVYIAPPQYRGIWHQTLGLLDREPGWLEDDGWAIVQIHPREFEDIPMQHLEMFDQRRYGSVMLCFYGRRSV
ncbi:MAG: 16S rRNA (guanine(966)-N(2))-methyltransferase RsmD [Chloroflexi bacterium]|nr:16S rRNA (guanine(966)-N(2))-methyltransferase RsmD [Chloroflexota bacterium]